MYETNGELKNERPEVLMNKDKMLKKRRDRDVRLSDEKVDHRQVTRAEEQAAISARMLCKLQISYFHIATGFRENDGKLQNSYYLIIDF